MSKTRDRIKFLEYSAEKDVERINKLEAKIEVLTRVEYGEEYLSSFGVTRLEVSIIDVVNSILKHLELEISHKSFPIVTETEVILRSTKKKAPRKKTKKK